MDPVTMIIIVLGQNLYSPSISVQEVPREKCIAVQAVLDAKQVDMQPGESVWARGGRDKVLTRVWCVGSDKK